MILPSDDSTKLLSALEKVSLNKKFIFRTDLQCRLPSLHSLRDSSTCTNGTGQATIEINGETYPSNNKSRGQTSGSFWWQSSGGAAGALLTYLLA